MPTPGPADLRSVQWVVPLLDLSARPGSGLIDQHLDSLTSNGEVVSGTTSASGLLLVTDALGLHPNDVKTRPRSIIAYLRRSGVWPTKKSYE